MNSGNLLFNKAEKVTDQVGAGFAEKPRVQSSKLLQGQKEIWIRHSDQIYRLRVTSQNKLILTK